MAIYSLGMPFLLVPSPASALCDYFANSGTNPKVLELGVSQGVFALTQFGIGFSANGSSVVQTNTTFLVPEDYNDPRSRTSFASSWSTRPTLPSPFMRRATFVDPTTTGSGGSIVIFTWPRGLSLGGANISAVSNKSSLCIWNFTNNVASTAVQNLENWIIVDE